MLLLRDHQLAALADAQLVRDIRVHLRRAHREQVQGLSIEALSARIAIGVARARAAGLTWTSSIAAFVALMFTVSPVFDRHPRVIAVLQSGDAAPDDQIFALGTLLSPAEWGAVAMEAGEWPEADAA